MIEIKKKLHQTTKKVAVLEAIGLPGFYEEFENCGCTEGTYAIIQAYKKAWRELSSLTKELDKLISALPDSKSNDFKTGWMVFMNSMSHVNFSAIRKKIDPGSPYQHGQYISKTVIPNSREHVKNLDESLEKLNQL